VTYAEVTYAEVTYAELTYAEPTYAAQNRVGSRNSMYSHGVTLILLKHIQV